MGMCIFCYIHYFKMLSYVKILSPLTHSSFTNLSKADLTVDMKHNY